MLMRKLGRTGLDVSEICLGTMTWGQQNTEAEGHAQMDYALDQGINFFDTAEMYAIPPKAETQGSTETIIGTWFAARRNRQKVILATKIAGRSPMNWMRDNDKESRITRKQIDEAVGKSLKRLQTDYIDLYQLHWPDRPMANFGSNGLAWHQHVADFTPFEEILDALNVHVKAGRIRHIGVSNETPWGVMRFLAESGKHNLPRMHSIQNAYNLINRTFELGLAEIAFHEQVGLLAYSPLGQGFLTGKYHNGANPPGSRKQLFNRAQRYERPEVERAIGNWLALAKSWDMDPAQLAIAFVIAKPFVTSCIIGATTMAQLKTDIAAHTIRLTAEQMKEIDRIHHQQPNPAP